MATFLGLTAKTAAQLSNADYMVVAHVADTTDYRILITELAKLIGSNLVSATIAPAVNTNAIAVTGYSLTGSDAHSLADMAGTWNTSGTPTGIKLNITDTASNAASLLMDLQIGSSSKFNVTKAGAINAASESLATTITSATPATQRLLLSEITCTPATTFAVAAGGSLAGVRGSVVVSSGKTFTDGFLYGTQGKVTLNGTMDETSAARIAGVIGQVDLSTGTVTDGQVSAVWGDFQGTPTLTDPTQVNILRATNSSNATVNSVLFAYGAASLFAQIGADGGPPAYFGATAPTGLAKSLKITVQGTNYYIPLYTAAS